MWKLIALFVLVLGVLASPVSAAPRPQGDQPTVIEDNFVDNRNDWPIGVSEYGFEKIEDGAYHFYLLDEKSIYMTPKFQIGMDASVEYDFLLPELQEGQAQDWIVGIGLRAVGRKSNRLYYICEITGARAWYIAKIIGDEWKTLAHGFVRELVDPAKANHFQCTAAGQKLIISLNGKELGQIIDPDYKAGQAKAYPMIIGANLGKHSLHIAYQTFKATSISEYIQNVNPVDPVSPGDFHHP